jgi:MFS family permease
MYGYWFFHNLIFAYVIERLYWASRGMSNQQVVYTEIIYAVVVLILEVPTGTLADRWSKKILMVINSLLFMLEFIILIYADSFWHFSLAVFLAGIGKALSSGTSNALVYDSLKLLGREDQFEKISGRIGFFDYSACLIAALIGSYVAYYNNYVTTYWLSLISAVAALLLNFLIAEPKVLHDEEKPSSFLECMKEALDFIKSQSSLRFVLLFGIIIGSVLTYIDEFWQIYLNAVNIPVLLFGAVSASRMLSSSISGLYAYKLKNKFSYNSIFSILIVVITVSVIATSFIKSFWGLIPLIACFLAFGVVEPLIMGYLHHRTESRIRATVESFQSLILRGTIIFCGLLFGYYSTYHSIFIGFRVLGIILLAYGVYFMIFKRKYI